MDVNISLMERTLAELRAQLKDALLVSTVWDHETGLPLVGYNSNPVATALLTNVLITTNRLLVGADMPAINRYFVAELQHNRTGLIVRHGRALLHGILVDTAKTNLGVLMSIVLPKMLAGA
jgi:molybdopterin-guanine dinucleotide biosynthesis protein A